VVKKPLKANNKRVMQPFAMSPNKIKNVGKSPLDVCQSLSKRKMKPVHGNEESIRKAILRVKKERKNNKPKRFGTTRQEKKRRRISQSYEGEDTSSNEDVRYYLRSDSSGVEVRGDSDYMR